MNNVSIVILNYNGADLLNQFLPSVIQLSEAAKIIVVDNGSTDQSVKVLTQNFPSVDIIQLENNYGFCGGYNRSLKQIESEYIVLLNSDVEVTPNWLTPLLSVLKKHPNVAAVQPKILSYTKKDHFEYAGAGGGFIDSLGYPFCRGRLFNYTAKDSGQYNDTREVFWTSGACMAIRSEIFHDLGGFDETFFAHMEEIDLCWRIQRAGLKVFYCGESQVYHVGGSTLSKSSPRKTYYNFRNGLGLIYKHFSFRSLLIKLPIRILLDYLAIAKFTLEGNHTHSKAVLQAHYDFLKTFKSVNAARKKLKKDFEFSKANIYSGLIPLQHYLFGQKQIDV